jgi:Bacterial conjugation TrbI-like protein
MKSLAIGVALATLCAAGLRAQSAAPSETTSSDASLASGTVINAELNSSIDSKKAKPGEQVTAHTTEAVKSTDGRTILPRGAKIIGHVTQASARSKGEGESVLAIQFDKAILKDKQEVLLNNVTIQAVAAPGREAAGYNPTTAGAPGSPSNTQSNNPSMSGSRGARPEGTQPTSTNTYPTADPTNTYPTADPTNGPAGESNSGPLPANMRGVYGMEGVRLNVKGNAGETVLTSSDKNVHLDGGTRLLLAVQPQSGNGAPSGK